jgi:hypothetical protein
MNLVVHASVGLVDVEVVEGTRRNIDVPETTHQTSRSSHIFSSPVLFFWYINVIVTAGPRRFSNVVGRRAVCIGVSVRMPGECSGNRRRDERTS